MLAHHLLRKRREIESEISRLSSAICTSCPDLHDFEEIRALATKKMNPTAIERMDKLHCLKVKGIAYTCPRETMRQQAGEESGE